MNLADHKSTKTERLSALNKLWHICGEVMQLLLKYCIYCVSVPILHRESTDSLINGATACKHSRVQGYLYSSFYAGTGTRGCCSSEPCSWQNCAWCCCRRGPRAEKNSAGETCRKFCSLSSQTGFLRSHCTVAFLCSSRDLQAEVELVLPDNSCVFECNRLQLTSALISSVCH